MKTVLHLRYKATASLFLTIGYLVSVMVPAASANLIRNGSFETVPGTGSGFQIEALMPSDWITVNQTPDTYSNDGSYGLLPSAGASGGNFTGVTAQDGVRWVAGWSLFQESFSQQLSATLSAGQSYTLSGYLIQAKRADLDHVGGYDVYLTANSTFSSIATGTLLGRLGPTTDSDSWEANFFNFTAPLNAGLLPFLTFQPVATGLLGEAYPGLDNLSLDAVAVPEPTTMIAGALLLLPFGVSTLRALRKQRNL